MRVYRNDEMDEFVEDMQKELAKSQEITMMCVLCQIVTSGRVVGFDADGPARPIIFAVCDECKEDPDWEYEANERIAPALRAQRNKGE